MGNVIHITPQELSERLRGTITVRTLANWRVLGRGPKFIKAGSRVLYPLDEVQAWEKVRSNTAQ